MRGWVAYLACFIGVCGHASSEFVAKLAATPGPEFSVWRFMIGGIGLLFATQFWPGARDLITPIREDWRRVLPLAFFGMSLAQLFFHWALDYASIVQVATMVTAMPMVVVGVDWLINRTPVSAPKLISGFGAFIGVLLLLTDGYLEAFDITGDAFVGTVMAFGCAVTGAFYLVLVRPAVIAHGAVRMTAYTFVLGFFVLYLIVGFAWGLWIDPLTLFDKRPEQIAGIFTIGIWNTTIAMILWLAGLSFAPDLVRANYMFFLKPVIAAFLAIAIIGDSLSLMQGMAIFAILFCVGMEYVWTDRAAKAAARRAKA